ncbi:MAG: RodZ domain-containing protein [Pseudomonas sp.]|uniref:RodZ domain-containing protein n=1 Tax=Pseudomonas sp. TaxID=306 RepID=UPI003D0D6164
MKAAHPEVVATPRVNPGESLRKARESKNLSIAEVAAQLNLTPQRLGQIEAGAFDKLPGHTFARGYIRAYAKLLDIDQTRLVAEFDQFTGSDAVGSHVQSLGRIEEPVSYSQRILRFVSFALLLALGAVGFYWWQEQAAQSTDTSPGPIAHVEVDGADGTTQIHTLDELEDQAVVAAQNETELSLPDVSDDVTAQVEGAEEPVAAAPSAEAPAAESPAPAPVPAAPVAPTAETPVAPAPTPAAPPIVAVGEGIIRINFIADCWTQVTDATGKVLFSALKRGGDNLEVSGKAPLELRLGFARGAQVTFNGQAVDVAPFVSGETARLKLGQ